MSPLEMVSAALVYLAIALLFYGVLTYLDVRYGTSETPISIALSLVWPVTVTLAVICIVITWPFFRVHRFAAQLGEKHREAKR